LSYKLVLVLYVTHSLDLKINVCNTNLLETIYYDSIY